MTKVNIKLFTDKGFQEAKEIRSKIIRGETTIYDLDDNTRQRVFLLYRHAFIIAGDDLLKNEGALVNNMKISLTEKVEGCQNRIKEMEDEMTALHGKNFSIRRNLPLRTPPFPPSAKNVDDEAMTVDEASASNKRSG